VGVGTVDAAFGKAAAAELGQRQALHNPPTALHSHPLSTLLGGQILCT